MIEIRQILCPIDFSDYSRRALDHAVAVARWYGAAITALHVVPAVAAVAYAPMAPDETAHVLTPAERDRLLLELATFIEAELAPGVAISAHVMEGPAPDRILAHAEAIDADLLVMGTHGRSGFAHLLLGSVTEKVLRKAACPVLSVPRRHPDAVPASPVLFKRVLCPIDFSDSSRHALEYALSLAQEADADLTVLHAIGDDLEYARDVMYPIIVDEGLTLADFRRQREEDVRKSLQEAIPESASEYCHVETLTPHGRAWREILRAAAERQADLIVMGVQGRGAVDRMFFGSTTQHVVRQATCPVLTLRHP